MNSQAVSSAASLESLLGRVADEFTERHQRGERPDIDQYARDYPEIAELLRQVLPALQVIGAPESEPAAADDAACGGVLGDFRILREVGRGGMGVVYEAEQLSLRRRVALKVLPFAATLDPRHLQRFKNESHAAGHLHHTNIVPVYFVGSERGVHFYAMQLIEGQTLAAVIDDLRRHSKLPGAANDERTMAYPNPTLAASAKATARTVAGLSTETSAAGREFFRTVARLGVQAAEALDHAHEQGVIHRDIKPSNLLVDGDGHVWITDFGLAQFQAEQNLTMTGDLIGTLRYMSPEQALAQRVVIDQRTDVYSLGVTLYELLTLQPAFRGDDRQELLRQIAFEEPRRARRLNKEIPSELETIVRKAIEKNPADRYATARELADDLRRWLEDKVIKAKPPSLRQRAMKWARRHQAVVSLGAVLTLVVATALGWIVGDRLARRLEAERRVAMALGTAAPLLVQGDPQNSKLLDAVRTAEAQLASGVVGVGLRRRVEALVADHRMLARLEDIRMNQWVELRDRAEPYQEAYAQAFREYGIDVDRLDLEEAAARLRERAIAVHLAAALDNRARAQKDSRIGDWKASVALARAVDTDIRRRALRDAWTSQELPDLDSVLDPPRVTQLTLLSPITIVLFATIMREQDRASEFAVRVLRRGQELDPGNVWLNCIMAETLLTKVDPPQPAEAVGFYRAALAVRPLSGRIHYELVIALHQAGRSDEADSCLKVAAAFEAPRWIQMHTLLRLAEIHFDKGDWDQAMAYYHKAGGSGSVAVQTSLGDRLAAKGDLDAAVPCFKAAAHLLGESVRSNPKNANLRNNLAWLLANCVEPTTRDGPRAVELAKEAVELSPTEGMYWNTLGSAQYRTGDWESAIAALEKSQQLSEGAHLSFDAFFLAMAHWQLGHKDEARKSYGQAVEWMDKKKSKDEELLRFRAEAEALLGLKDS